MPIQPGTQLGAFTLEESIGRGSLGPVYRARHQTEQRTAVVKLLQPLAGDPDAKTRFRNEMQAVSRLRHPNILTIYDVGTMLGLKGFAAAVIGGLGNTFGGIAGLYMESVMSRTRTTCWPWCTIWRMEKGRPRTHMLV